MERSRDLTTAQASVIARHRITIVIAVFIPAAITGWMWHQWTRTDAYQIERIEAEAEALLPQLEGTDSSDRWMAMLALAKNGDWAASKPDKITNPYYQIQALRLVAATLAKAGLPSQAHEVAGLLQETSRPLQERACEIKDPVQQVTALQTIIVALADTGLAQAAGEAARQALTTALSIPDASLRSATLHTLAAALARHGLTIEATRAALEIKDRPQRLNALSEIASLLNRASGERSDSGDRPIDPGGRDIGPGEARSRNRTRASEGGHWPQSSQLWPTPTSPIKPGRPRF